MKIHHSVASRGKRPPIALAIGYFDGVHIGHRALFAQTQALRKPGSTLAALTFVNHPAEYLRPTEAPLYITTPEERVNMLAACGVEELYLLPFDADVAQTSASEFLDRYLIEQLRVEVMVVGQDFHFGHAREGNVRFAQAHLRSRGIAVEAAPEVCHDGERVSSSRIRVAIERGDFEAADAMLGEPYSIEGIVILGEGRGHDLGFPTANLAVHPRKALPRDGVYSTYARYDGTEYHALLSIGTNPTFEGTKRTVEVWIDAFDRTMYGCQISIHALRLVRGQERFASVEALMAAMRGDVDAMKERFFTA
jgi:riboflavin kinase/FMN adenylyltransferase